MFRMTIAVLSLSLCCLTTVSAVAAERDEATLNEMGTVASALEGVDWSAPAVHFGAADGRGTALSALYVSFAALQIVDGYTTMTGTTRGAQEANPLMAGAAGNRAALWAVKGGATLATIYVAERLWKNHQRGQAIAVMLLSNGVMAAVAAHNSSVLRTGR